MKHALIFTACLAALSSLPALHAQWPVEPVLQAQTSPPESVRDREEARRQMEKSRADAVKERARVQVEVQRDAMGWSRSKGESVYQRAIRLLDRSEWQEAVTTFDEVVQAKSARSEGALYWKAYALNKLGRQSDARAAISQLNQEYPASRWKNDAAALEAEMRQRAGQAASPEGENDDELKLIALNSLVQQSPERALPLLQKLLQGPNSPRLKERALFVVAQSATPQGRDLLAKVARGGSNPDLQAKAIEYLGQFGGRESQSLLAEVYQNTQDVNVRRKILQSYMTSNDMAHMVEAARGEKSPELRMEAIRYVGAMGGQNELWQLYGQEPSVELRRAILQGLMAAGAYDRLVELARVEKDPELRRVAIRHLGSFNRSKTADALVSMYGSETDKAIRRDIMKSLFNQQNAAALVQVARTEKEMELRREAVRYLSHMQSKEANDFLVELLNKD